VSRLLTAVDVALWALALTISLRAAITVTQRDRGLAIAALFFVACALYGPLAYVARVWWPSPANVAAIFLAPSSVRGPECPPRAQVAKGFARGHVDDIHVGPASMPLAGTIELPRGGTVMLAGWAVAADDTPVQALCVLVDGQSLPGVQLNGFFRPDVAVAIGRSDLQNTGFRVWFEPPPLGPHVVEIGVSNAYGAPVQVVAPALHVRVR
jgi:hypothetical protein